MQLTLFGQNSQFQTNEFLQNINNTSRLSAEQHLNIYRRSYIERLRDCMKSQFTALAFALGDELFQMFADQYLQAYPSESYTLNNLGKKFPDYLNETRPDTGRIEKETWIDFMIELARFEFAVSEIFDEKAENLPILTDETTPDEELKLVPVFRLFQHQYPICRYYLDVMKNNQPVLPFEEETFCTVIRNYDYRLSLLEIKPAQYQFLSLIKQGESISNAKAEIMNKYKVDETKFEEIWLHWKTNFIAAGYFCRV